MGIGVELCWPYRAQEKGAVSGPVINELMPIHIPLVGAQGTVDINGKRLQVAQIVRHSLRKQLLGLAE